MSGDELLILVILGGAAIGGLARGVAGPVSLTVVIAIGLILSAVLLVLAERESGYDRLGYFILSICFLIGSVSALVGGGLVWLVQRQRQG